MIIGGVGIIQIPISRDYFIFDMTFEGMIRMAIQFSKDLVQLFDAPGTVKLLTTVDEFGTPHTVAKDTLSIDASNIIYLESLESSRTNRNLVRSIWFDRKVSITLVGTDQRSYQIKGIPVRARVSGSEFQRQYLALRNRYGDVELGAIWEIAPDEIINESFAVRCKEEEIDHPYIIHLDRITATS